jgi:hypothetical protein
MHAPAPTKSGHLGVLRYVPMSTVVHGIKPHLLLLLKVRIWKCFNMPMRMGALQMMNDQHGCLDELK